MLKYLLGLFFVCCLWVDADAQVKLRRLKPSKKYTAQYACSVNEVYSVEQGNDTIKETEWVASHATLEIQQDILVKKKNYFQADYHLKQFDRIDTLRKADGTIDTATNQGKIPLIKLILHFDGRGNYLGPCMALNNVMQQQRDFKYFYNRCKGLVFNLNNLNGIAEGVPVPRTDTLFQAGFDLVATHNISWQEAGIMDTLGMDCYVFYYTSLNGSYQGSDGMMKALGFEALHTGNTKIYGRVLIDAKTGRLVLFDEFGVFEGHVHMTTPKDTFNWPTHYTYQRKMVLSELIKKPRKKILGIF